MRHAKDSVGQEPGGIPALARLPRIEQDRCIHCARSLRGDDQRALYVEEEVGRVFCSEECITAHFAPEIKRMEAEYFERLPANDLPGEERDGFAHLRWITLQEADEIWGETNGTGDYRYTLV